MCVCVHKCVQTHAHAHTHTGALPVFFWQLEAAGSLHPAAQHPAALPLKQTWCPSSVLIPHRLSRFHFAGWRVFGGLMPGSTFFTYLACREPREGWLLWLVLTSLARHPGGRPRSEEEAVRFTDHLLRAGSTLPLLSPWEVREDDTSESDNDVVGVTVTLMTVGPSGQTFWGLCAEGGTSVHPWVWRGQGWLGSSSLIHWTSPFREADAPGRRVWGPGSRARICTLWGVPWRPLSCRLANPGSRSLLALLS